MTSGQETEPRGLLSLLTTLASGYRRAWIQVQDVNPTGRQKPWNDVDEADTRHPKIERKMQRFAVN